jgi:hypothetical protein
MHPQGVATLVPTLRDLREMPLPLPRMERVTLQFQTPQDLTNFRKSVIDKPIQTDIHNLTLTCDCSLTDIALAMNSFGAKVIETND